MAQLKALPSHPCATTTPSLHATGSPSFSFHSLSKMLLTISKTPFFEGYSQFIMTLY